MRTAVLALLAVGLVAAPGLGVLNFKVTADGPIVDGKVQLAAGQTTTIHFWGQGTSSGLMSVSGEIKANTGAPVLLTSNAGSFSFTPPFQAYELFVPYKGMAGQNGSWGPFASQRSDWGTPDPGLGQTTYMEVCYYTVTALGGVGDVTLSYVARSISGHPGNREADGTGVMGTIIPVTIHVPEPVTLALLGLGTLALVRRRPA